MKSKIRLLIIVFIVLAAGGGAWWYFHRPATDGVLTLYGNLDFRYASVPFNGNERIAEVLAEEGMVVKKGQLLARLDTNRLLPQLAQSEAAVETQKAVLERLLNGSRKEEIAQAKAYGLVLENVIPEAYNIAVTPFDEARYEDYLIHYDGESYPPSHPLSTWDFVFAFQGDFFYGFGIPLIALGVVLLGDGAVFASGRGGSSGGGGVFRIFR